MKKILALTSVLALAACGQNAAKYQETGLLCEDATHDSAAAQITLDVKATDKAADIVLNGENITLAVAEAQEGADANVIAYYGTNANNEKVKLQIVLADEGKTVNYMLGVNSDETTYGCAKKVEEPAAEEKPAEEAAK